MHGLTTTLFFAAAASFVYADTNDWVNVNYVLKQAGSSGSSNTADSQKSIISSAGSTAKSGPWSVTDKGSVKPPSGNLRDYLSWAPYHWPDCNWCTSGTNHLANPSRGDDGDDGSDDDDSDDDTTGTDPYEDGGDDDGGSELFVRLDPGYSLSFPKQKRAVFGTHKRIQKWKAALAEGQPPISTGSDKAAKPQNQPRVNARQDGVVDGLPSPTIPVGVSEPAIPPTQSSSSVGTMMGTPAPAEAPAKTQSKRSSCTPSPTKSLAPSATWTTCPYVVRDGKVNPDVRTLPDSPAAVHMTESVLYNSIAYVLQKSSTASKNAAEFIDTFFISSKTGMTPNMSYGQLVRGPGKDHQIGTFTGVLDLRGLVKVVNGIQLLKAANSPDWTSARDQAMTTWTKSYISWLETSDLGKEVASKANNHLTFYVNQLAAAKLYVGDTQGATTAVKNYFNNQFKDQVAASGEQPFEASRTRPFHYRCFNLEAMITNAKIGDQLGQNFWTAKSKYGATIQNALDYVMGVDPGSEDISDIFPHVAAVAAAYGDPKGKYAAFLQKHDSDYKSEPFWFYDQTAALPNSPAASSKSNKRSDIMARSAAVADEPSDVEAHAAGAAFGSFSLAKPIPFSCPSIFNNASTAELDDNVYVTCEQVRSYYEILPRDMNTTLLVG
ncbi:chondroitin AC/alginate lyase [Rhodofomes roseus]|uniref:Chondroitin AC/alginate lyase n=1 Tax=Rhodofomes roseus TaxID=34475 RepID=A0ABQ8KDE0_9APHY|nr:chondroitin AC/alginate lyase [Rhodofomes roseus]KAH9835670.1 chondroitin AC/alginate lyase [Rhodofomes roseus]